MKVRKLDISNEVSFELFGLSATSVCSGYILNTARDLVTGDYRTSFVPKNEETFLCQNKSERVMSSTCINHCSSVKVNGS